MTESEAKDEQYLITPGSGRDKDVFSRKKPSKIISVPPELRRHTFARERDILVNEIKCSTGCSVNLHYEQGKISQLDIIGPGTNVDKAARQINQWVSKKHSKAKESSVWAKTRAFDPNKWYYEEVEEKERMRKQVFRGPIPEAFGGEAELQRVSGTEFLSISKCY